MLLKDTLFKQVSDAPESVSVLSILLRPMDNAWWTRGRIIVCTVLLGLIARLILLSFPNIHYPDEVYQYLEQSYRMITGDGVVPWEYHKDIRSWLFPLLLSVPMRFGLWLDPNGTSHILFAQLFLVGLSLSCIVSATLLGLRISRLHGALCGLATAVAFEFVYFAGKALTEAVELSFFMPAVYLLMTIDGRQHRRLYFAVGGFLLGLCIVLRFQTAPALFVLALVTCKDDWRNAWLPLIAGGLLALAISAAVDVSMGMIPMIWIVNNLKINIIDGIAAEFGTQSPIYFIKMFGYYWGFFGVLLWFVGRKATDHQILLLIAMINLLFHMLVDHKEYRFILLSIALIIMVAGLGSAYVVRSLQEKYPKIQKIFIPCIVFLWILMSIFQVVLGQGLNDILRFRPEIQAMQKIRNLPDVCGVAGYELSLSKVYLNQEFPIFYLKNNKKFAISVYKTANVILVNPDDAKTLPESYRRIDCFADLRTDDKAWPMPNQRICIYQRKGSCRTNENTYRLDTPVPIR